VDVQPGSPSTGDLDDGSTLPITQTASTVTLPDILDVLDSDVRTDLQTFLHEYGTVALRGGGAKAFNKAIKSFKPAYRYGALTNDALLGVEPDRDIQRLLRGQQRTFAALASNPGALKELVTDLNTTAGAIASEDSALEAAVPALRDTLREGYPALGALNAALPTLRTFSREALPGVRSSVPALDAAIPWITQARGLVQPSELRGLAADLRPTVPDLAALVERSVPLYREVRRAAGCQNDVIHPWTMDTVPDQNFPADGNVYEEAPKPLPGLAGESRSASRAGSVAGSTATVVARRPSLHQRDRVRQRGADLVADLADALRAAGEVHDQGPLPDPGDCAGEHPVGGVRARGRAHRLRDAGSMAVDHGQRRLGGHVAGSEPGAARRQYEVADRGIGVMAQGPLDPRLLVGDHLGLGHVRTDPAGPLRQRRAALVGAAALAQRGADGDDRGAHPARQVSPQALCASPPCRLSSRATRPPRSRRRARSPSPCRMP